MSCISESFNGCKSFQRRLVSALTLLFKKTKFSKSFLFFEAGGLESLVALEGADQGGWVKLICSCHLPVEIYSDFEIETGYIDILIQGDFFYLTGGQSKS